MSPSLEVERDLVARFGTVACVDEVGRGCLAGPLAVGVVVVTSHHREPTFRLDDSKKFSEAQRESMLTNTENWAVHYRVEMMSAQGIDEVGLTEALTMLTLSALTEVSGQVPVGSVLLDGKHNYLEGRVSAPVTTVVKADSACFGVAAASILAKVRRDRYMVEQSGKFPAYGWQRNKGYGTREHKEAIRNFGLTPEHRKSWKLT